MWYYVCARGHGVHTHTVEAPVNVKLSSADTQARRVSRYASGENNSATATATR
jgi:hypothetical protein